MRFNWIRRLWGKEGGFSLFETSVAVLILGTVGISVVVTFGITYRSAARAEESVTLAQLIRAQIETIKQAPFNADASQYPSISDIPEGFTVIWTSTDAGLSYAYPVPAPTPVTNVVQKITVTAQGDFAQMSMDFYKLRMP